MKSKSKKNPRVLSRVIYKAMSSAVLLSLLLFALFALASCGAGDEAAQVKAGADSEPGDASENQDGGGSAAPGIPDDEDEDYWWWSESEDENNGSGGSDAPRRPTYEDIYGPEPEPQRFFSYLTGIETTRRLQRRRPVAIVINNLRPALPNIGISHADIIYEFLVEGNVTRLMAVLTDYEEVPVFGSMRSARDYFLDISEAHNAIFVHAGGSDMAYVRTNNNDPPIERLDGVNPVTINGVRRSYHDLFYRDPARVGRVSLEHTMMISGESIAAGIQRSGYRATVALRYTGTYNFHEFFTDIGGVGNEANYIRVPYSSSFGPEFIYNPEDNLYYRRQFGEAHKDGGNDQQIRFENVIIMFAHYAALPSPNPNGYLSCELTGTGFGFYITGGKYKTITWHKETRNSVLNFYELDGAELFLNPGRSFICVAPSRSNRSVVITDEIRPVD